MFIGQVNNTVLGPVCFRSCDQTAVLFPNQTVLVNNQPLNAGVTFNSEELSVFWKPDGLDHGHKKGAAKVSVPGLWNFYIEMKGSRNDIYEAIPLPSVNRSAVHGVLGHTLFPKALRPASTCNSADEGGCEVMGGFKSYEVGDYSLLCEPKWSHSMFDPSKC